jgi:DNA-binding CsgD family transcriptional regulator
MDDGRLRAMQPAAAMLQSKYLSVLEVRDGVELRQAVIAFAQDLGFKTATAITVIDHTDGESDFIALDNSPLEYQDFFSNRECARRDPVMQHCKRQSLPIVWDRDTYVEQGHADLWEEQARFGYCTGIAMALHLPEGRHFALGVDRDQALPRDPEELSRMVADLQLFTVHALDSALRLLCPPASEDRPTLTRRELEALRWTLDGKTAEQMSALMSVSERTAVFHINNAMHKLNCVNKHQAALKALRLGLI